MTDPAGTSAGRATGVRGSAAPASIIDKTSGIAGDIGVGDPGIRIFIDNVRSVADHPAQQ
ncbi:hypothetical protein [Methylobacterium sp. SI9]|uniref:hypothetical protein n=1 Tax=Methylobacterium guangdongense TaxID=3138811 RepID=UPI00313AEA65